MKQLFTNKVEEPTLLMYVRQNVKSLLKYVDMELFARSTYTNYSITESKVRAFIWHKFKGEDIVLKNLTSSFISDFEEFLKIDERNNHNTAIKHCLNLKRIIGEAKEIGLIENNPFDYYSIKYKEVIPVYLDENDLQTLVKAKIKKPNHLLARDLFLFQCYTGFGFNEMLSLSAAEIIEDNNGRKCKIKTQNSSILGGENVVFPMLSKAIDILEKYVKTVSSDLSAPLLPNITLYEYNKCLKELAFYSCFNKKLNTQIAKNTYRKIFSGNTVGFTK
jgi:integrase